MKYRKLGRTGLDVSEIGIGLEHLLSLEQSIVTDTLKAAINGGVTYLDCHPGHDFKEDMIIYEGYEKLGKAFHHFDRNKLCLSYIATAVSRNPVDAKPRFENYLKSLKTDHTDVFMVQFCDKTTEYEQITGNGGLLEYAKKLKIEGKTRYIGISTHSSNIAHKSIESGDFDVIMYPVNPAFDVITNEEEYIEKDLGKLWDAAYDYKSDNIKDTKLVRKDIYTECLKNNIGLIAMKPFGGGFLFRQDINTGFTPLNLIAYVLTQTGVSSVVPGCTSPEQIEEILTYYTCPEESLDFSKAILNSRWNIKGACQYCNHCLPCNVNLNIGQINRIIDNKSASEYNSLSGKASECVKCGECEERCPFGVKVMEKMDLAVEMFE